MREEKNSKCKCEVKPCLTENGEKGKGKIRKTLKRQQTRTVFMFVIRSEYVNGFS